MDSVSLRSEMDTKVSRRRDNLERVPHVFGLCSHMVGWSQYLNIDCISQKLEWWFPGAGERGEWVLMFNGDRVSVLQDKKSSGDGWWGWLHNNMNAFN